jgi:hypothetical protein
MLQVWKESRVVLEPGEEKRSEWCFLGGGSNRSNRSSSSRDLDLDLDRRRLLLLLLFLLFLLLLSSLRRQQNHVDVVVDTLQQELALEGHDAALLRCAERAHEGLDWVERFFGKEGRGWK